MRKEDKQLIKTIILDHMLGMMDIDQATHVTSLIVHDVVKDVEECTDGEIWNDSDVRLAIGRVLIQRLSPAERKVCDRARLNTADEYEPLNVRITEEEYPIYYRNKLRELMDENGMTEEDAREALDGWEVTLELVYHTGYGGFAVEAEAVETGTIYSPYNGTLCEVPEDEV
jgi:hypothetical protein